jgi:hypothetical protein
MKDKYKEIVLKNCEDSMIIGDDGFFMFAPKENTWYTSHDLTIIAEELTRRNQAWANSIAATQKE